MNIWQNWFQSFQSEQLLFMFFKLILIKTWYGGVTFCFLLPDKPKEVKNDSFVEKLATQVIKNLQIKVSLIHIRYEDKYSNPARPVSMGVTLNELLFQVSLLHKILIITQLLMVTTKRDITEKHLKLFLKLVVLLLALYHLLI